MFPRGYGVFLEELEAVVEPHLLSGIDERLPVGQREGQQRHHACRVAHALEFRPGPRNASRGMAAASLAT